MAGLSLPVFLLLSLLHTIATQDILLKTIGIQRTGAGPGTNVQEQEFIPIGGGSTPVRTVTAPEFIPPIPPPSDPLFQPVNIPGNRPNPVPMAPRSQSAGTPHEAPNDLFFVHKNSFKDPFRTDMVMNSHTNPVGSSHPNIPRTLGREQVWYGKNDAAMNAEAQNGKKSMIFYGLAAPIRKLHSANELSSSTIPLKNGWDAWYDRFEDAHEPRGVSPLTQTKVPKIVRFPFYEESNRGKRDAEELKEESADNKATEDKKEEEIEKRESATTEATKATETTTAAVASTEATTTAAAATAVTATTPVNASSTTVAAASSTAAPSSLTPVSTSTVATSSSGLLDDSADPPVATIRTFNATTISTNASTASPSTTVATSSTTKLASTTAAPTTSAASTVSPSSTVQVSTTTPLPFTIDPKHPVFSSAVHSTPAVTKTTSANSVTNHRNGTIVTKAVVKEAASKGITLAVKEVATTTATTITASSKTPSSRIPPRLIRPAAFRVPLSANKSTIRTTLRLKVTGNTSTTTAKPMTITKPVNSTTRPASRRKITTFISTSGGATIRPLTRSKHIGSNSTSSVHVNHIPRPRPSNSTVITKKPPTAPLFSARKATPFRVFTSRRPLTATSTVATPLSPQVDKNSITGLRNEVNRLTSTVVQLQSTVIQQQQRIAVLENQLRLKRALSRNKKSARRLTFRRRSSSQPLDKKAIVIHGVKMEEKTPLVAASVQQEIVKQPEDSHRVHGNI